MVHAGFWPFNTQDMGEIAPSIWDYRTESDLKYRVCRSFGEVLMGNLVLKLHVGSASSVNMARDTA